MRPARSPYRVTRYIRPPDRFRTDERPIHRRRSDRLLWVSYIRPCRQSYSAPLYWGRRWLHCAILPGTGRPRFEARGLPPPLCLWAGEMGAAGLPAASRPECSRTEEKAHGSVPRPFRMCCLAVWRRSRLKSSWVQRGLPPPCLWGDGMGLAGLPAASRPECSRTEEKAHGSVRHPFRLCCLAV